MWRRLSPLKRLRISVLGLAVAFARREQREIKPYLRAFPLDHALQYLVGCDGYGEGTAARPSASYPYRSLISSAPRHMARSLR